MPYDICIFDLDGTLTDPYDGLVKGISYAIKKLGIKYELTNPGLFIGPPLHQSFQKEFGLSEGDTDNAVAVFREYYADKGLYENEVFAGIPELLKELKEKGAKLGVATTKPDNFARLVLKHFDLYDYFDCIQGDSPDFTLSRDGKQELIRIVLDAVDPERKLSAVMIGDRHHDINGASKMNIGSIGVMWGYGSVEEFEAAGATHIAHSVDELRGILLG